MLIKPPQSHGWDNEYKYNFTWSSKMYPKHVAEFLALTSSLNMSRENNNTNEYDGIEADVSDVFVVERDDDNCYI